LFIIGFIGLYIYQNNGLETRQNIIALKEQINNLSNNNSDTHNSEGLKFIEEIGDYNQIILCKFTNSESEEIIGIFGDSHGLASFSGISKINSARNIDTLFLGRLGHYLPYIGLYNYVPYNLQKYWEQTTPYIYNKLINNKKIKKIFIITRGTLYINNKDLDYPIFMLNSPIPKEIFQSAIQLTIDIFLKAGKKVYFVTETPILSIPIVNILRPYKEKNKLFLLKEFVIQSQEQYLSIIPNLNGATIINTMDLFCPGEKCLITNENGDPLYSDDDHLSKEGSLWQAEKLLYKYLIE
jgi:hypothetical protein